MVIFKNKYGEIRSGWALLLLMVSVLCAQMVTGIFLGIYILASLGPMAMINDYDFYMETVSRLTALPWLTYVQYTLMIAALLWGFYLIYKRPLSAMGLYAEGWLRQLLFGGLFGIVLISLNTALLVITGNARIENANWRGLLSPGFLNGLVLFVFVGIFEEVLSRGAMMTALKTTRQKWLIFFGPAVVFGLLHAANPNVTVFSLVNISLVGLLFAYIFIKTGRLWAPIGFHITWNFFQGNVLGIEVSGTDTYSIMDTVFTGPDWITGGSFGAEGGAVCTLVILLGLAYIKFLLPDSKHAFWSMDGDLPLTRVKSAETVLENQAEESTNAFEESEHTGEKSPEEPETAQDSSARQDADHLGDDQ